MIINISSKTNDKMVNFAKLKQKKYREKMQLVLLEGERIILDAIDRKQNIQAVCVLQGKEAMFDNILSCLKCDTYILTQPVYDMLASTENSQGIIAVEGIKFLEFKKPQSKFLILDRINDPGNLGTIIRTAVAGGFTDLYLIDSVDYLNDKVLRSTMGTIFSANVYNITTEQADELVNNYTVFIMHMQGKSIYKTKVPNGIWGIMLGNEANGISQHFVDIATEPISIPMENNVESLNVATATAIAIYTLNNKGD